MRDMELVDDEQLIFALLQRDKPVGVTAAAELDVDSIDELPLVTFSLSGGDQESRGPGLWSILLNLSVFDDTGDGAWNLCRALYRVVHEWAIPGGSVVDGLGYVSTTTDLSKFSRVNLVELRGKRITQYSGSFALTIRN